MTTGAPQSAAPRATGTSLAAIVLVGVAFVAVMALHLLRADLDPLKRVMSEYANGAHGVVMTVAFYAFGLAAVALGIRLRTALAPRDVARLVPWLLGAAGAGLLLSGVFEVGRAFLPDTIEESIHSAASIAAFVTLIAVMLLFSFASQREQRWRSFAGTSWTLATTATAAAMLTPFLDGSTWSGALQRLLGGVILLWLLLTARRIRTNAFGRR